MNESARHTPLLIYLHGFASSPGSFKARRFIGALPAYHVRLSIPDLNEGDFEGLTISRQLALLERLTVAEPERSVLLIGSSLGGYTAALFAAASEKVAALVAMAPAFDFARRWAARLGPEAVERWRQEGSLETHHYGQARSASIGFGLLEDAGNHAAFPDVTVPTLVFHGEHDDTVDPEVSRTFARDRDNVTLAMLPSDHMLGDAVEQIIAQTFSFLTPWLERRVK